MFGSTTIGILFLYLVYVALTPVHFDLTVFGALAATFLAIEFIGLLIDGRRSKKERVMVWDV